MTVEKFNYVYRCAIGLIDVNNVVYTEVGRKAERYYEVFVDHSNIMAVFNISAPHVFVRFA